MGKAKRLRKARMRRNMFEVVDVTDLNYVMGHDLRIPNKCFRYGHRFTGRNPKVLAKRRRQRERLAFVSVWGDWDVRDRRIWIAGLPPEPGRLEKLDAMVQQRAEQLHAIAEGRS